MDITAGEGNFARGYIHYVIRFLFSHASNSPHVAHNFYPLQQPVSNNYGRHFILMHHQIAIASARIRRIAQASGID